MDQKKPENHTAYLPICMCLGLSFGTAIGAALDNIGIWMCIGISLGVGIGSVIDARKKSPDDADNGKEE